MIARSFSGRSVSIALFLNRYGLVVFAILEDRSGIGGKIGKLVRPQAEQSAVGTADFVARDFNP